MGRRGRKIDNGNLKREEERASMLLMCWRNTENKTRFAQFSSISGVLLLA